MKTIYDLLSHHDVTLLLARGGRRLYDDFERDMCGWRVSQGDAAQGWHHMTIDTNEDESSGLTGGVAVNTLGAWAPSKVSKTIHLDRYGEISFEHYVKNDPDQSGKARGHNLLRFFVDGQIKLEVRGPSPWYRCEPIGLLPGDHELEFEYILPDGDKANRKAVIDTITVWQAQNVRCLITKYTPPYPSQNRAKIQVLRGFTAYQQMTEADTKIEFTAAFEGIDFQDFMIHADDVFYLVDEFGVCYRGVFDGDMGPESVALCKNYAVELTMIAGQKTGIGFC